MNSQMPTFRTYLSDTTGKAVQYVRGLEVALPQYLEAQYRPYELLVDGQRLCAIDLLAEELPPPGRLVKQLNRLVALLKFAPESCCIVSSHLDAYSRKRLVELKQAYCLPGQQLYWPALGFIQTRMREKGRPEALGDQLSPAAQQVLLAVLLGRLELPSAITGLAEPLNLSPISASRAAAELTQHGLLQVQKQGRERRLQAVQSVAALWELAQPVLRNPIMRVVRVHAEQRPEVARLLAGESALAAHTMLGDAAIATYAMAHRDWKDAAQHLEEIGHDDEGLCRIELWRYPPERLTHGPCVDPLSLALSLREEHDERVSQAVQSLLEMTL